MKIKTSGLWVVLVLLTTLAAQCATPQASPAPATATPIPTSEAKIFKLGVMGPFTGPSADVGEQFQNATKMAFENIDYRIGDYQVELVWIDCQSDPEKATRAYEKAVTQDGIQAGMLNWHSSVAVAVMEVTAKHKVPHFFTMGATEIVNEKFQSNPDKYSYWNFKMWPVPAKLTVNYVTAIEDAIAAGRLDPGQKRAAIYGEDTDWGRGFGNALKQQLEQAGWTIVGEEYFPLDQTEFLAMLNKFKDAEVDLVGGTSTVPASLSAFIEQADEAGLKSLIIADGLGWIGDWYDLTGDSSNYVVDQIPGWTTNKARAFATEFQARWGMPPSPSSAGLAYDAANFFIQIAQATYEQYGVLDKETLYKFGQEKVQTGQFTYTDGLVMTEYKYTDETAPDPIVGKGYYTFPVLQYMNGKGQVIWPDEWKVAEIETKP